MFQISVHSNHKQSTFFMLPIIFFLLFIFFLFIALNSFAAIIPQNLEEITIPVLTYHKFCIGDIPDAYTIQIDHFKQQMNYLKENKYDVISVSQLIHASNTGNLPRKPVVITIDDGFKSVYTLAYPILKEFNFPASLYLYTDFLAKGPNQLSWQEIHEMQNNGIEIGSHSLSHCNLLKIKENETYSEYLQRIKLEILHSKEILEKNTGSSITSFAYPYGVYSEEIQMLAKEAGYQALLNVNHMNNSIPIDHYSLNRQIVSGHFSLNQFISLLQEKTLKVKQIFPADGTITENQDITIGIILNHSDILFDTLSFNLSGSGPLDFSYYPDLQKVSFTPTAPKLLQKRTWIAQVTAKDEKTNERRKVSWLFTIK